MALQLRAHIHVAEKLGKPLLLTAFGKQRRGLASYMDARNALFDMVYQETQHASILAGDYIIGTAICQRV